MASQLDGPGHGLNLASGEALAVVTLLDANVIMAAGTKTTCAVLRSNKWG